MTWKCNCPLCRVFVHPLLNRVSGKREGSLESLPGKEEIEERIEEAGMEEPLITPPVPVEKSGGKGGGEGEEELIPPGPIPVPVAASTASPASPIAVPPVSPTQSPSQSVEGQDKLTSPLSSVDVQIPKEFIERIDQLEEEIGRLRKELSTINESLKGIILEVKEVLAEASSPFNVLRTPVNETGKREKEFNGGRKKISGNGKQKVLASKAALPPSKFVYLTKIASDMLKKMGRERAIELVRGYIETGVLDKETGETLVKIIELVDKMRSHGLSVEEQLPFLYSLAKTLGIDDPELEKLMLKELLVGKN